MTKIRKPFNRIREVYASVEEARQRHGFEKDYGSYFDLREPYTHIRLSNYRWKRADDSGSDYLKEFELWRSVLMSGKLEKGRVLTSDYHFEIKTKENENERLKAMFREVDSEIGNLHEHLHVGNERREDGLYHASYYDTTALTTIDKLPEHLKKQRRELIFRRTQTLRAASLLSILSGAISSHVPPADLVDYRLHGWEDFLNCPDKKLEEVNRLLLESNPSRLDDDVRRYTENVYDFLGVPLDAREKDYQITLPEGG